MSFGAHTSPFSFDKTNNHIHIPHNAHKTSKADTNHSVSAFFLIAQTAFFAGGGTPEKAFASSMQAWSEGSSEQQSPENT